MASNNLSRVATQFDHLMNQIASADDDIRAFGGDGECWGPVMRGIYGAADEAARLGGYQDVESAIDAIERATTYKFVYTRGYGHLVRERDQKGVR